MIQVLHLIDKKDWPGCLSDLEVRIWVITLNLLFLQKILQVNVMM